MQVRGRASPLCAACKALRQAQYGGRAVSELPPDLPRLRTVVTHLRGELVRPERAHLAGLAPAGGTSRTTSSDRESHEPWAASPMIPHGMCARTEFGQHLLIKESENISEN